eukprot:gene13367-13482_t
MLVLAGCAGTPLTSYDLSALPAASAKQASHIQLVIAEPLAVAALDSERILVRGTDNSLAYLGGAQWSARLPTIVQARLVQSFENSHSLSRVARPGDRIVPDYQLDCEIRAFELDVASGQAIVEIEAKLVDDHTGKITRSRTFSQHLAQTSNEPKAVTQALNQALGDVMSQMVGWTAAKL